MAERFWFSLVTVAFFSAITRCALCEQFVYITRNIAAFPCKDIPNDGVCPPSYRIPNVQDDRKTGKLVYNSAEMTRILTVVMKALGTKKAGETCKNTSRAYFCSRFLPVCADDDDFVYVNGNRTVNLCEKSRQDCPNLSPSTKDGFFNCTELRQRAERHRRRQECIPFPLVKEKLYPCPPRLYKVPAQLNFTELVKTQLRAHDMLRSIPNLNETCRSDTANVVCDALAPVCTDDMKYIVYLLSKQECRKIMTCLNETKNVQLVEEALGLCGRFPDGTKSEKIGWASAFLAIFPTKKEPTQSSRRITVNYQGNGDQHAVKTSARSITSTISLLTLVYLSMV